MKILITGSSGMLGRALCQEFSAEHEIIGLDIIASGSAIAGLGSFIECDITDREQTTNSVTSVKPDLLIHAAAYTDVDGCETNPNKAEAVNARGSANVVQACRKCNCLLIYISTDFVFDGEKKSAYLESDQPNPINAYGESKLKGEKLVESVLKRYIIIRSSWLFGRGGKNFVNTILTKAKDLKELKVVSDQRGSPTYTNDLAKAIKKMLAATDRTEGIYHITNSNSCSWYEFARAIIKFAGLSTVILPVSSSEFATPARRPTMSILENKRYQEFNDGEELRSWKEALEEYLGEQNQIRS